MDLDFPDGDDPITTAINLVLLAVALVLAVPVVLVLTGVLLELAVLLALLPLAVLVRVALRRPWTVRVVSPDRAVRHTEQVVGWRTSGARVAELAERIRTTSHEAKRP
jgi:hypothetical protein